jgi:dTDP-glucose 4,6-dehydratase
MRSLDRMKVLITGGAGFIGSHVVRFFVKNYPQYHIYNLDNLTYAANLENLKEIEEKSNYTFIKADVTDADAMMKLFEEHTFDGVIHLAAESHVDRSIEGPKEFIRTNVFGTFNLLQAAKITWEQHPSKERRVFHHISTDEVYGSLGATGAFTEDSPYDPRSPYSASKASSDHLVMAFFHTYHLPTVITNCSNNYGPFQFPEKLIPLMINNIKNNKPLPVYGKGENVRDWLYVDDHVHAIDIVFHKGRSGEKYNVGGSNELKNIELVKKLCELMDEALKRPKGTSAKLITFVKDRPGHDARYAINASKIKKELGWAQSVSFEEGLKRTVAWYLANEEWLKHVTSGAYKSYYEQMYSRR